MSRIIRVLKIISPKHTISVRRILLTLLIGALAVSFSASAASNDNGIIVPVARDLQEDAQYNESRRLVLLLIIARTDCNYCALLKRAIIRPMIASGAYQDKVIIRELLLDDTSSVIDFDGTLTTAATIAHRYKEQLTPTVLFLSPSGVELTPRIRGINTVDYYGYYLDEAIEKALLELNRS